MELNNNFKDFEKEVFNYIESFNFKTDYIISYQINETSRNFVDASSRGKNIHLNINFNIARKDEFYFVNYKQAIARKIAEHYLDSYEKYGKRIYLKRFSLDDLEDYFEIASNKNVALPDGIRPVKNLDQARRNLYNLTHKRFGYGIYLKENDKLIGTISSVASDRDALASEIGYSLNEKYWHQGYAREAVKLLLDTLFLTLDYDLVEAYTFLDNDASLKLLTNFNFKKEGILRKKIYRFQIGTSDVYSLSLTKSEYLSRDYIKD